MNNRSKMAWGREGPDEKPFLQGQIGGMLMRYVRNRTQQTLHADLSHFGLWMKEMESHLKFLIR